MGRILAEITSAKTWPRTSRVRRNVSEKEKKTRQRVQTVKRPIAEGC